MILNTKKSEVAFSVDTLEVNWQPAVWLNGNGSPRLLVVHPDRMLSFGGRKATSRCRVLPCLATKEWGWQKNTMKKVYISLCLDFVATAWQPLAVGNKVSMFGGNTEQGSADHDWSGGGTRGSRVSPPDLWQQQQQQQAAAATILTDAKDESAGSSTTTHFCCFLVYYHH